MTLIIVAGLLGAWGWFGYITWRDRAARTATRTGSMAAFSDQLSVLGRTAPAARRTGPAAEPIRPAAETSGPSVQRLRMLALGEPLDASPSVPVGLDGRTLRLSEAQRRRRYLTFGLGGAALVTILLAVTVGGGFSRLAVVVTALALAYMGLLARARQVEIERAIKVRRLLPRPEVPALDESLTSYAAAYGEGVADDSDFIDEGYGYRGAYGSGYGYAN